MLSQGLEGGYFFITEIPFPHRMLDVWQGNFPDGRRQAGTFSFFMQSFIHLTNTFGALSLCQALF